MKKITLTSLFLVLISTFSIAATGWFNDFLTINVNGTVAPNNYYIGTDPVSGALAVQGKAFGLVTALEISGADMKYWSDTQDRTGAAFYYKITNTNNTFDFVAATEIIMDQVALGGNDFQGTKTTTINLLAGLPAGSYQLHVWAKSWGTGEGDSWLSNNSANYVATFMKAPVSTAPMSGIYKIGNANDASFNLLSAAVTALNTYGVGGDVFLEIASDITEVANIGLGVNTNSFGITIRPDADVDRTITFTKTTDNTSPSGHFVIGYTVLTAAWADANTIPTNNVSIDGYATGGSTRRLKFTTSSGSLTASRLIMVIGACQNTTVKNCIIESKSTGSSALCLGTIARKFIGTGEGAPNGFLIENNIISSIASASGQGLMTSSSGTLVSAKTTGLVVRKNIISAQGRAGWFYYINGGEFDGNEIKINQLGNANTVNYGLWTGTGAAGTFTIKNNKFTQITTMEATASGSLGIRALSLGGGTPTPTYNVYNNTFAGIDRKSVATSSVNLTYVFFGGLGEIFNNTFYMPSLTAPTTPGYYTSIQLSSANPAIKNNIFISNEDATANAFYSAISTASMDYNVFYHRAGNVNARFVTGSSQTNFADYKTANPTKDINSKNANVEFTDVVSGDLRIAGLSVQDANLKVPSLAAVTTDILGTVRNTEFTYAGAHESTLPFLSTEVGNGTIEKARIIRTLNGVEILLNQESKIELYTINGVLIDKANINGTYSRDLNNGVYIIRINGIATKFIK
jgi:hypothetical protein